MGALWVSSQDHVALNTSPKKFLKSLAGLCAEETGPNNEAASFFDEISSGYSNDEVTSNINDNQEQDTAQNDGPLDILTEANFAELSLSRLIICSPLSTTL